MWCSQLIRDTFDRLLAESFSYVSLTAQKRRDAYGYCSGLELKLKELFRFVDGTKEENKRVATSGVSR